MNAKLGGNLRVLDIVLISEICMDECMKSINSISMVIAQESLSRTKLTEYFFRA